MCRGKGWRVFLAVIKGPASRTGFAGRQRGSRRFRGSRADPQRGGTTGRVVAPGPPCFALQPAARPTHLGGSEPLPHPASGRAQAAPAVVKIRVLAGGPERGPPGTTAMAARGHVARVQRGAALPDVPEAAQGPGGPGVAKGEPGRKVPGMSDRLGGRVGSPLVNGLKFVDQASGIT